MDIDGEEITVRFDDASKGKNPVDVEAESNTKEGSSMQATKKPVVEDLWKPVLPLNYLFPPDYEFYKNDAQQLWCLFGGGIPNTLIHHHFFQFSRIDNSTGMPMYKLKNMRKDRYDDDYLSMYQYLIIDDVASCIPKTTMHISVRGSIDSSFFENLYEIQALKTLFILRGDGPRIDRLPFDLFRKLPYLQALDLSHTDITELPSSIRFSQQLRHLNLSYTSIVELPNSLCNILTLETLNLRGCLKLRSLPKAIRRLTSLKHLDVDVSCLLLSMPPGVGDLCQLQTLPAFVVGKQYGWHINELKNLKDLRQNLRVLRLENLSSPEQAKEASLHSKYHLQKLEFHWSLPEDGFEVLESLRPGQYIQELQIVGYGGAKFPSWIGEPSFFRLTTITIHNCSTSNVLPSLGKLCSLKFLHISDMDEVKAIDQHFSGNSIIDHENTVEAFAMLEQLTFIGMPELNQWVGVGEGDFPRLQKLKISHCPKLQILPKLSLFSSLQQLQISLSHSLASFSDGEFPISLQSIVIVECPKLKERYHKDIGENWEKLAHVTDIWIDYQKICLSTEDPLVENMTSDIDNEAVQEQESIKITVGPGMDMPIMHDRYEYVRDISSGNFGVVRLLRDKQTRELVAVKYIERGDKIDGNVKREIINHRSLRHPNIVRFREVILTPTHLAIVMEYASGGELFDRICNAGRFSEDEARFLFQQLVSGVSYCHSMQVCHRDLKLENTLLDGSPAPRLKICDFGYSKSSVLHSQPKSTVGTPAYIAPEVILGKEYDGRIADVWSCGVTLFVMLVGAYPFEDPREPRNFKKTIQRILSVQYSIPDHISPQCQHLISRIFVANPSTRITMPEIRNHEWFLKNLPVDLMDDNPKSSQFVEPDQPMQSSDEIMLIIAEATIPCTWESQL